MGFRPDPGHERGCATTSETGETKASDLGFNRRSPPPHQSGLQRSGNHDGGRDHQATGKGISRTLKQKRPAADEQHDTGTEKSAGSASWPNTTGGSALAASSPRSSSSRSCRSLSQAFSQVHRPGAELRDPLGTVISGPASNHGGGYSDHH